MKETINVKIAGANCARIGTADIRYLNRVERSLRFLKFFALWSAVASVSIVVPILHFLLVPLFVLVGAVHGAMSFCKRRIVTGGCGECPYCGGRFEIARSTSSWPLQDRCALCFRNVSVVPERDAET